MKKLNDEKRKYVKDMIIAIVLAIICIIISIKAMPEHALEDYILEVNSEAAKALEEETENPNDLVETVVSEEQIEVSIEEISSEAVVSEEQIEVSTEEVSSEPVVEEHVVVYHFRNDDFLTQHFEKHGKEFSYATKEEYEAGASAVVNNPNALHKLEAEDGDDVYYLEETNEFVIVSTDGFIRTYFKPNQGIDYFNRQ